MKTIIFYLIMIILLMLNTDVIADGTIETTSGDIKFYASDQDDYLYISTINDNPYIITAGNVPINFFADSTEARVKFHNRNVGTNNPYFESYYDASAAYKGGVFSFMGESRMTTGSGAKAYFVLRDDTSEFEVLTVSGTDIVFNPITNVVRPKATDIDLGTATYYWDDIHYHNLVSHSKGYKKQVDSNVFTEIESIWEANDEVSGIIDTTKLSENLQDENEDETVTEKGMNVNAVIIRMSKAITDLKKENDILWSEISTLKNSYNCS